MFQFKSILLKTKTFQIKKNLMCNSVQLSNLVILGEFYNYNLRMINCLYIVLLVGHLIYVASFYADMRLK